MALPPSDALVIFGATGDLAFKKIFPALHAMVKRGRLDAPVVTVGRNPEDATRIHARARESVETHGGGADPAALDKLTQRLSYVGGDYAEGSTFAAIRAALGAARHPTFYLAIPPSAFYENTRYGKTYARFAFCKKEETLAEAERRLSKLKPRQCR